MADFEVWQHQNLVQFAKEANERIKLLNSEVEALNSDLKTAIDAYRHLLRGDSLRFLKATHPPETQQPGQ
jgi:hypothetical protein